MQTYIITTGRTTGINYLKLPEQMKAGHRFNLGHCPLIVCPVQDSTRSPAR